MTNAQGKSILSMKLGPKTIYTTSIVYEFMFIWDRVNVDVNRGINGMFITRWTLTLIEELMVCLLLGKRWR